MEQITNSIVRFLNKYPWASYVLALLGGSLFVGLMGGAFIASLYFLSGILLAKFILWYGVK